MKTFKGIKIGLFVIPRVFIADAISCNSDCCCFTQLPKNTSIQKDWERMWEKRQDRGRVRSKVGSRGLFVDSIAVLDFQKKILGPAGPQVFIFCRQNKYSGRQKLYLRINGFSFVKDNGLSLVYVFPKKKVTYLGGQVGDQS